DVEGGLVLREQRLRTSPNLADAEAIAEPRNGEENTWARLILADVCLEDAPGNHRLRNVFLQPQRLVDDVECDVVDRAGAIEQEDRVATCLRVEAQEGVISACLTAVIGDRTTVQRLLVPREADVDRLV